MSMTLARSQVLGTVYRSREWLKVIWQRSAVNQEEVLSAGAVVAMAAASCVVRRGLIGGWHAAK